VFAWYHHEQNVCDGTLAVPKIGAMISTDGGDSFRDLGIIMESPYTIDCNARNGFFAGGHGDFSVMLDATRQYFYIYFGNYSGPLSSQGIGVARMAFADRRNPVGRVFKYYQTGWSEPGVKGRVTAVIPAAEYWSSEAADAFWGPSIHWNTYLRQYVMLMNRTCCEPGWPNEGIYVSFNPNLRNPFGWSIPEKILEGEQLGWYPQVIGTGPGMTDKLAGRVARFFLQGESHFEIVFRRTPRETEASPPPQ
jgi:hypothetical protein